MSTEEFRRKAEELMRRAAETKNLKERGALIDEALHWHYKALTAMGKTGWAWALADLPDDEAGDRPV